MITAALCHVLLPLVRTTVCTVAPREHAPSFYHYPNQIAVPLVLASPEERISTSYWWMLRPSWDFASKGTLSSSQTIKEQRPSRPLCWLGGCATKLSSNTLVFALQMITATLPRVAASCSDGMHRGANGACAIILPFPKSDCRSPGLGFTGRTHIDTLRVEAPAIIGFRIERDTMITAALSHVLLLLVRTVCTVAPMEHAPSFYQYSIQIAVPLFFASPEERKSTPYYWMLQ
ncbi:hypothetical protein MRX96_023835 [Rhipicephalus microplus]